MDWIAWAPLAAASLHVMEEFVLPGGFPAWDRQYRSGMKKSVTTQFLVMINALMLFACFNAGVMGASRAGLALWLTMAALLAANGIWHLVGAARTRSYSPGMVTGTLLYLPMAVYGYGLFVRSGQVSLLTAMFAFALGASYQFWSDMFHAFRARQAKAKE